MACAFGVEELAVVVPLLVGAAGVDRAPHLVHLELDNLVVRVAFAVVVGQDAVCFFLSTARHEPAQGLGQEEDEEDDDDAGAGLGRHWQTPVELAFSVVHDAVFEPSADRAPMK